MQSHLTMKFNVMWHWSDSFTLTVSYILCTDPWSFEFMFILMHGYYFLDYALETLKSFIFLQYTEQPVFSDSAPPVTISEGLSVADVAVRVSRRTINTCHWVDCRESGWYPVHAWGKKHHLISASLMSFMLLTHRQLHQTWLGASDRIRCMGRTPISLIHRVTP